MPGQKNISGKDNSSIYADTGISRQIKKYFLLSLLFLSATFIFGCTLNEVLNRKPEVTKGFLDLSGYDLQKTGSINLKGEWEFYWNRLIEPAEFHAQDKKEKEPSYITVPSVWNKNPCGGNLPASGYATYRLVIKISRTSSLLAIRTGEINTSYRLWVNGAEIKGAGIVGDNKDKSTPGLLPQVTPFAVNGDRIEIVLQVSNFHYKDGGIHNAVEFGPAEILEAGKTNTLVLNYILFGSLLIMGLYHFGLYRLRREDLSTLLFGIFCLIMTTRILSTNEMFILTLFPNIKWENHIRIIVLGYYVCIPVFFTYMHTIFSNEYHKPVIRFIQIAGLLFSLIVIFTPPIVFARTELFYQILIVIGSLYLIAGVVRAAIHKRDGAVWVLVSLIILFLTTLNDILYAQYFSLFLKYQSLVPLGLFIFIFSQSYILSVRFSRAFRIANIDDLTRIYNRRRFYELAEEVFINSQRNNREISLLFMDIDYFKSINDTYGHDAGDIVLAAIADTLKKINWKNDILGRMGGEEFALLVNGDITEAASIAEDIRKTLEGCEISVTDRVIRVTISIGVASSKNELAISLKKLFKNADMALYKAKENGRNRVMVWE